MQAVSERQYSINEAAEQIGVHPGTLRRYEREGITPPARRTIYNSRYYTQDDIEVIRIVTQPRRDHFAARMRKEQ